MKAITFHALIVLGENDWPYWLYSCMTNLFNFHIVFSSSTLIHLNKYAFEGHLWQTVNNFVKQNKITLNLVMMVKR